MTGTAKTEEEEFVQIYNLEVVEIPTNLPIQRMDQQDAVYKTNEAKIIKALDDRSFLDRLIKVFDNRRGQIELDTPSSIFPISLALADNLVKEKFALIGDSAHNIHPIAGQGLNLGIRDVACLSEILISARRCEEDIGGANVLRRYSKWRTSDILTMALFTDITNKIFSNLNLIFLIL